MGGYESLKLSQDPGAGAARQVLRRAEPPAGQALPEAGALALERGGGVMGGVTLDFSAVLAGQPGQWLLSGLLMTLYVTIAGSLIATVLAVVLLALRIAPSRALNGIAVAIIEVFR